MQKVLEKGDGANTYYRRCQSQIPSYFRKSYTRRILSFSSVLFQHMLLAMALVPVDEPHSSVKASPLPYPFLSSTQGVTQGGVWVCKWLMLVTFLWMRLGGGIKRSCSSWSIPGIREECTHPLIQLGLALQSQNSQPAYEEGWIALLASHFCVPVNIHYLSLTYSVNLRRLPVEKKWSCESLAHQLLFLKQKSWCCVITM